MMLPCQKTNTPALETIFFGIISSLASYSFRTPTKHVCMQLRFARGNPCVRVLRNTLAGRCKNQV